MGHKSLRAVTVWMDKEFSVLSKRTFEVIEYYTFSKYLSSIIMKRNIDLD